MERLLSFTPIRTRAAHSRSTREANCLLLGVGCIPQFASLRQNADCSPIDIKAIRSIAFRACSTILLPIAREVPTSLWEAFFTPVLRVCHTVRTESFHEWNHSQH